MTATPSLEWGPGPARLLEALDRTAAPFWKILAAYGLAGDEGKTRMRAVAESAIRGVVVPLVVHVERHDLSHAEVASELELVGDIGFLAKKLADRIRRAEAVENAAHERSAFSSPIADLLANLAFGANVERSVQTERLRADLESVARVVEMLASSRQETSKSRLPTGRERTRSSVRALAKLWAASEGQLPLGSSGAPRSRFVALVQEWEVAAGRAPGPAPNSIRGYLSKLAPNIAP